VIGISPGQRNGHVSAALDDTARRGDDDVFLQLVDVVRRYGVGDEVVRALDGVTTTVRRGVFSAVKGWSRSGKSTPVNVVGCLNLPTSGTVILDGEDVNRVTRSRLPRIRREKVGFVFQQINLIPSLTAIENVMLPMEYAGLPERERRRQALAALAAVGMEDRLHHRPTELSGGQQQRTAMARALAPEPAINLADEATGALDARNGGAVIELMRTVNQERRQTFMIVTFDPLVADQMDRIIRLQDGEVASD
jgi:putative ABC transport system ATP-binding protein